MNIRRSKDLDVPILKALWSQCFHDEDEYINLYFQNRFVPDHVLVLEIEKTIAGMIHLLPCWISPSQPALYWYAACIDEQFRGKGYFRSFCKAVFAENRKKGFANICLPVEGLENFYRSIGFQYSYSQIRIPVEIEEREPSVCEPVKAEAKDFRMLFQNPGSLKWDDAAIEYAIGENRLCGGEAYKITLNQKEYPYFVVRTTDGIHIENTNLDEVTGKAVAQRMMKQFGVKHAELRLPCKRNQAKKTVFGLSDHPDVEKDFAQMAFTLA